jgi:hypothetical protein
MEEQGAAGSLEGNKQILSKSADIRGICCPTVNASKGHRQNFKDGEQDFAFIQIR